MWNHTEDKPIGMCRLKVINPKNGHKYLVPFVVFKDDRMPILGFRTSKQMRLITVESENFEIAAISNGLLSDYKSVFDDNLGNLPGTQALKIDPEATPRVMANRRTPLAIRPKLKQLLDDLVKKGVITPVNVPTPWVSQVVLTHKKSGELRICLDPHEINKVLQRERYTLPVLEDVLHELGKSKVFSKADLSSGYWHVTLDEDSSFITTFQTCFGRYRYLRLPFGINGASEYFQKKLLSALEGLQGVVCIADDVIIHGESEDEHDINLKQFLSRCKEIGIKLNANKLDLKVDSLTFMGHKITANGVAADPEKIRAITDMQEPKNVGELRTICGMINYVAKFLPNLNSKMFALNQLLKKDVPWNWSTTQRSAFSEIKNMLTTAPVLAYYDPSKKLVIENDACEYGLGTALLQDGKPIAYASRSLSEAERRYAQIEKEMLAVTFGLERFHHYTFGRNVNVITDHKPLIAITSKPLSSAPKRLQNLLLRAQQYDFKLEWKPGKDIPLADTLSRAPTDCPQEEECINAIQITAMGDAKLDRVRGATAVDATLKELIKVIMEGWPSEKRDIPTSLLPYFHYRDELSVQNGVVYRSDRIVIPMKLRGEMKKLIHVGHLGINSCLRRARDVIYWPGMSAEIRQFIETCATCATYCDKQPQEPQIITEKPKRPWSKVASDLFYYGGRDYVILVDYYSGFFEIDYLTETTSKAVIAKLSAHFSRYGPPNVLISDNAAQYDCENFKSFAKEWGFQHDTSSPGYSQGNGAAEAAVKIAKRLLRKCQACNENPFLALLNLRNVPTESTNTSPAQRSLGRRTDTQLPTAEVKLTPDGCQSGRSICENKLTSLSGGHKGKELKELTTGDNVRMQPIGTRERTWKEATVTKQLPRRSYVVTTTDGKNYRRNRRHLRLKTKSTHSVLVTMRPQSVQPMLLEADSRKDKQVATEQMTIPEPMEKKNDIRTQTIDTEDTVKGNKVPDEVMDQTIRTSRSGRILKKPNKYNDFV